VPYVDQPMRTVADPRAIALVELDLKKVRVRIVLAREAISERLRELEYNPDQPP